MFSKKIMISMLLGIISLMFVVAPKTVSAEDINNTNENFTEISPVMSFYEMVEEIARNNNISTEQVKQELGQVSRTKRSAKTYRHLTQQFTVTSEYRPTMRFYCETSESGGFRTIKRIIRVEMIRGYKGLSKQFSGEVFVNLEDPNIIYYSVNGDFYNNGQTTYKAGVDIKLGQKVGVGFSATYATSWYKYCYTEGRVRF